MTRTAKKDNRTLTEEHELTLLRQADTFQEYNCETKETRALSGLEEARGIVSQPGGHRRVYGWKRVSDQLATEILVTRRLLELLDRGDPTRS